MRLHSFILLRSSAVAGIVNSVVPVQPAGIIPQRAVNRQPEKVETAYQYIGLEPLGYVHDPLVRAAAYQHALSVFFY